MPCIVGSVKVYFFFKKKNKLLLTPCITTSGKVYNFKCFPKMLCMTSKLSTFPDGASTRREKLFLMTSFILTFMLCVEKYLFSCSVCNCCFQLRSIFFTIELLIVILTYITLCRCEAFDDLYCIASMPINEVRTYNVCFVSGLHFHSMESDNW